MSIAVSAVLKPSRLLLVLVTGFCLGVNAIGWALCVGLLGSLAGLWQPIGGGICLGISIIAFCYNLRSRKTLGIDISGIGQIRLNEYTVLDKPAKDVRSPAAAGLRCKESQLVSLREGSTLWPMLLILFIEFENGRKEVLRIMPDSVPPDTFRALVVACRWIAARNHLKKDDI
jgi:toxin CptA